MRKPDGTCGIRYVESTGWWKVRIGGVGGSVIRISGDDFKTLVEYLDDYNYKRLLYIDKEADMLYALLDDMPRDWFDTLVKDVFPKYRLSWSVVKLARHRKVSSGYLLLKERVERTVSEKMRESFLERVNWNIHAAVVRDRFDWYEAAIGEKVRFLREPRKSRAELLADFNELKRKEFGV